MTHHANRHMSQQHQHGDINRHMTQGGQHRDFNRDMTQHQQVNRPMNQPMNQPSPGQNPNDQVVAQDLLQSSKASVHTCAMALTETSSPEVRSALKRQLDDALHFHDQVTHYMMDRGLYSPHNMQQQIQRDITNAGRVSDWHPTR